MRSARVEHLIRFLKCPIKIADTFRPYFFGIPYKSRAVIPHAIAASSWAAAAVAAVDFATQRRDLVPEVAEWALAGEERTLGSVFGFGSEFEFGTFCNKKVFLFSAMVGFV